MTACRAAAAEQEEVLESVNFIPVSEADWKARVARARQQRLQQQRQQAQEDGGGAGAGAGGGDMW